MTEKIISLARSLWDYHHMNHALKKSAAILVLGSHDTRVAERGAELFLEGWAPLLILSGGLGRLTSGEWTETEADRFAKIALEKGVPSKNILIENKSTNTGENIIFTRALLKEKQLDPENFIVVQKPYMERRSYATFKKQWPSKEFIVTSPQIAFEQYPTDEIPMEKVIQIMTGDLQRIRLYGEKGFQVPQEVPGNVWSAFEKLVAMGFDEQLIKN
ncbi:MAG: YdcF family protein [Chitinophagaceae bacterium]|nr:YdcF family protein [Chitinophagaceae bacterium]